jgi:hypothetical protein
MNNIQSIIMLENKIIILFILGSLRATFIVLVAKMNLLQLLCSITYKIPMMMSTIHHIQDSVLPLQITY